ncbi:hypothetical protein PAPHI01_1783 [Pancytospora philotis]|nr:hypothetical protein PAPHI01_1783 [Pancytospora philotis]
MLAQIFQTVLLWCHYALAAFDVASIAVSDLQSFGAHDCSTLNSLENWVLDSLFEHCVQLSRPEFTHDQISEMLLTETESDKARYIITFILHTDAIRCIDQLQRLVGRVGFGGHCLLHKLFAEPYVTHLEWHHDCKPWTETYERFIDCLLSSADNLTATRNGLLTTVENERLMTAQEYDLERATTSCSIDYMLFEIKNAACNSTEKALVNLWELLYTWVGDPKRFSQHESVACELFSFLLKSDFGEANVKARRQRCIAELVIKNGLEHYTNLLRKLGSLASVTNIVYNYIRTNGYSECIADMIWYYTDCIREVNFHHDINRATYVLHKKYFPAAHERFYAEDYCWKKYPLYFNKISPRLLCSYFTELFDARVDPEAEDEKMKEYMRMLSCDNCAEVLKWSSLSDNDAMTKFILGHLDRALWKEYMDRACSRLGEKLKDQHLDVAYRRIKAYISKQNSSPVLNDGPSVSVHTV